MICGMAGKRTRKLNDVDAIGSRIRRRASWPRVNRFRDHRSTLRRDYKFIVLVALVGLVAWMNFASTTLLPSNAGSPSAISGQALVIDGDTIKIHGQRIRLFGIDAPEGRQTCRDENGRVYRCGQRASIALNKKIGRQTVSCEQRDIDRYGRIVAVCVAGGEDLNGWLVSEGFAVAYTRYSMKYVPVEMVARINGRGVWAGDFTEPETWRRQNR
jgi:endonuclease YncB( thermonuclease family)